MIVEFTHHGKTYQCTVAAPVEEEASRSRGRSHLDTYVCKSRHKGGAGCGMHSIRRTDGDAAIESLVCQLADVTFLLTARDAALALQEARPVRQHPGIPR